MMGNKLSKETFINIPSLFLLLVGSVATIFLCILLSPIKSLAWGDSSSGRTHYTIEEINTGALEDTVTFNSIVDPEGIQPNEPNFVSAQNADVIANDVKSSWYGNDVMDVKDGGEYLIRLYVHNNNVPKQDEESGAASQDTRVQVSIPGTSGNTIEVNGFITSSNATPDKYWDYINFHSNSNFHLEYVYGSAIIYNNAYPEGLALSDEIVTTAEGALIGYDKMDGIMPGGYQYACYITLKVRAVYDYEFEIDKKVRLAGTQDEFTESVDAKVGDKVEFQIEFHNNTANDIQENVIIRDVLPNNMAYIANTTYLYNSNHQDGKQIIPDGDLFTTGINIGAYKANASGWVRFTAEVVDKDLACGDNVLVNWAQGMVSSTIYQDHAAVRVKKPEKATVIITVVFWASIVVCLANIIRLYYKLRRHK